MGVHSHVLKKYKERVRIEKNLNQPPTERITNSTWGRPLIVAPVIDEKVVDKKIVNCTLQNRWTY